MTTSLQQQLKRLATPQTSALKDTKKRASILFDQSEAATKDRETIYDIGISGLKELIAINQSFQQFEDSLFNSTSITFERSVETNDVNKNLNKLIRKFLFNLSPYFLIQPSHKCLEWLIRRYQIHEYNKDDFIALILPYYSTRMFVRCIQIVKLHNAQDPWHWLYPIQRPGVQLAKQTLFNRVASDAFFMKFISKYTLDAVKELATRAHTLQAIFGFYVSTILGGLDAATQITDTHITNLYLTISKGFASNISDFCATSIMITGFIVTKAKLSLKFLNSIVLKSTKIMHPQLQMDAIVLLILIFERQAEIMKDISNESLIQLVVGSKWIPGLLGKVCMEGINVLPFYLPLMSACLRCVQLKGEHWRACKLFCENLLMDVMFKGNEAESVIRCILDAYIIREKNETDVINLESDDDDGDAVMLSDENIDINEWYTEQLKCLERQYSEIFDKVVKDIMQDRTNNDDIDSVPTLSKSKGKSLKTVLGFLFTVTCTADGFNIFENLYHYSAENRIMAVKHLVRNLESLSFSDDSKDMLKDSIAERINDDSPNVCQEVLRFHTNDLVRILGTELLIKQLLKVVQRNFSSESAVFTKPIEMAITHLTKKCVWDDGDSTQIFIEIFPFLLGQSLKCVDIIANSDLAKKYKFLEKFRQKLANPGELYEYFHQQLKNSNVDGLPPIDNVLGVMKKSAANYNVTTATFAILLLTQLIDENCDIILRRRIFDTITQLANQFDQSSNIFSIGTFFTMPIYLNCVARIYLSMNGSELTAVTMNFKETSPTLTLIVEIFSLLLNGIFPTEDMSLSELYADELTKFLTALFLNTNDRLAFCANFFSGHFYAHQRNGGIRIDSKTQLCSIRLFNRILMQIVSENHPVSLSTTSFIRILSGLSSPMSAIRMCTIETFQRLIDIDEINEKYIQVMQQIVARQEELILDSNQLPLILLQIFLPSKTNKDSAAVAAAAHVLNQFLDIIANTQKSACIRAITLCLLRYVNDERILSHIAASALDILSDAEDAPFTKPYIVNVYDSIILKMILYRYTQRTINATKSSPIVWELLQNTIDYHHVVLEPFLIDGGGDEMDIVDNNSDFNTTTSTCALLIDQLDTQLFDNLLPMHKTRIIQKIVHSATHSENVDVTTAATKFIRRIELNASVCVDQLKAMRDIRIMPTISADSKKLNRSKQGRTIHATISIETLCTSEWLCGQTWLEYLQNKKRLIDAHVLIPYLFDILKKCLDFDNSHETAEYAKQLTLGCILHCCELISPDGRAKRDLLPDKVFRIDLVVQCIRGTPNPQTHHHALQLLSHTAAMIPEQVLQNMMEIFTFMGSTVVRRDDAYTYQIISNIIKSIIPTLIKSNDNKSQDDRNDLVIPVIRVFCDIILDVPEHRRLCLYTDLLQTLDAKQYLWMFLIVLFESHVHNFEKDSKTIAKPSKLAKAMADTGYDTKRITIAVDLCMEFDCTIVMQTISQLIEFLHQQPFVTVRNEKNPSKMDIDITDTSIFNIENYTDKQLRHFRYTTLQFIGQLTKPESKLPQTIFALNAEQMLELKPYFKDAIVKALQFLAKVIKTADQQNSKYWKFLLANSFDILEQIISLLSPDMLLQVVGGLMNNIPEVRRKAIELLNKKLQQTNYFADSDPANVLVLLEPFTVIVQSICDDTKLIENATTAESVSLQQHALIAIKLMSVTLANDYPDEFTPILLCLSATVKRNVDIPTNVLGQLVLCLAEVCANLRAHAIPQLSKFMPALGKLLQKQIKNPTAAMSPLLVAIYKIVETLPLFLSPYIVNIIANLSKIWARVGVNLTDAQKRLAIINKLEAIWMKLGTALSMRLLVPVIDQVYDQLCTEQELSAIGPCIKLLGGSFTKLTNQDIAPFTNDLQVFFLRALQFRSEYSEQCVGTTICNDQEIFIIDALVALILKLSESSFRPLYVKAYEWALKDDPSNIDRAITFFQLSHKIAESLKSLFVLFANDFLSNAADLLKKYRNCIDIDDADDDGERKSKIILLLNSIIQTLYQIFLYDSQGFINHYRFDILMEPLVDQLDNEIVLQTSMLRQQMPICLAQLARAANDDTMWKQLNHQILMKTRDNNAEIRLFALNACVEVAKKLGDDFMPLLPETVPFLAELMEDENSVVEKQCQASIQELERTLGESLQKYF